MDTHRTRTTSRRRHPAGGRRPALATAALALVPVVGMTALAACGSDDDGDTSPSANVRTSAPATASFTGTAPSALESLAASAKASVSAAASSASARASEFEASVSADVSLTGKPRAETGGLLAVVVHITNRSDDTASYAVQVDFRDPDGKVVETRYAGAEDLAPGERAQPLAISRKPPEPQLTAEIAKAQRY
ncbi:FxLYD domain-containing protein [Streptomyces sp. NPDC058335]|uniref:FxLYD domain-containing protein n=1 Tax=Streptomyces sp. NPDC058335 TaxID=3346451 RepID=UPI00364FFCCA